MSSISISFDPSHNPEMPTMVLMKKSGEMFGQLDSKSVVLKDQLVNASEITFVVKKYVDGEITPLWDKITNFKLVYCVEWNTVFEIKVDVDETNETTKTVYGTELAQSELSQIMLFNNEFNTEADIARDDYVNPTVLYKPNTPSESLLHLMLEKAPHYTILHVDDSIKNIQRTFSFDNVSLYDAFNQVAEEIDCVFIYNSRLDSNGDIIRGISVYDLETICNDCGHRGDYIDTCPKCDSTNLTYGYGEDTTIFITADKLASDIQLSTDVGAVKNCFKLKAGDDLMTATVRNCSPDGSGYIWYISDKLKEDMSDELVEKLDNYDAFYSYYQNSYNPFSINTSGLNSTDAAKVHSELASNSSLITSYNNLINKYSTYTSDYHIISSPIIGYSELMKIYYDTISFYYYLNDSLMPTVTISETNAQTEANKLNNQNLKNTAVQNLSNATSVATVSSALLAMAKVLVDTNYQVKIVDEESTFTYSQSQSKWRGKFVVTNYSDDSDTYTTSFQTIDISSDYATFIKQKVEAALAKTKTDTIASINDLFKLSDTRFKNALKTYSLQRLKAFHDACQGCLDILQQQGIANDRNEDNDEPTSMYSTIYLPYYNKLGFIQSEMDVRQSELDIIQGKFDENGGVLKQGVQTVLQKEIDTIQSNLNLQEYLGNNLWLELLTYRREDMFSNDNYISDGLDNAELFDKATEFIQTAKTEIKKSATLQHTITATLKNLLVMKEFSSIVDYFKVGNWLRIQIDDVIYKLRLVDYEIDFDNLENINITFSDITVDNSGVSSIKDILSQASNMTTTYNTVTRQAKKGNEGANILDNWVDNGLMTTKTKIVDSADNQDIVWDKHGLLCREYDISTGTYSDKQLKLINKGLYLTDNNWRTAKAGIGNFTFYNPMANNGEGAYEEAYGVIADTIVGNIILGQSVGIYNTKNSLTMDENGFVLTTNGIGNNEAQSVFTIRRKTVNNGVNSYKDMFYIDSNGYVTINGGVKIDIDGESGNSTMIEMVDGKITTHITDELSAGGLIESSISQTASQIQSTVSSAVSKWDVSSLNYNIDIYGYGHPQTDNGLLPSNYSNKHYLDQTNGYVYYAPNGSVWSKVAELTLITSNLSSQITQTAESILSTVSSTYETKTDSNNKKTALESSVRQTASNIASTVKATSGWDISSLGYTINLIGTIDRGNDHSAIGDYIAEEHIGEFYLDDLTGHVYESKLESGSTTNYAWWWKANLTRADSSIYSRIDQTANSITSTVSSTYETKEDASTKKTNLESTILQTATSIKSTVAEAVSKYSETGYTISIRDYGVPNSTTYPPANYSNQLYLNQENGAVYKSNGSAWSRHKDGNNQNVTLPLITTNLQSQITQNATNITSKVSAGDFGTLITQNASNVQIAWNKISKYISFENAALNIYDSTSQGVSHLLMRLNSNGLSYYDYNSSAAYSLQVLGTPESTGYSASNYAGEYYQNLSNNDVYLSDGVNWKKVDGLGSRFNMRTDRNGAFYYYEGLQLGKIGTNTMGTDHANHSVRGLVFDLEPYAQYMTWAARNDVSDGYAIKFTYFREGVTWTNGNTSEKGFHFADNVYFHNTVNFNSASVFNGTVSFNNSMATDIQMNSHKLYLNSNSYIGLSDTGTVDFVGRTDKALRLFGYDSKCISIGGGGVNINTDVTVTGTVTSGSDARLKTNITDSNANALSLISNIELKEFDWIADESHTSVGIIAQQLKEVIPELVHENSETGMLSIKVDRFIPFLVKSVQELYVLCGGKKQKSKSKWVDTVLDKDKHTFVSSLSKNKPQMTKWNPPSKKQMVEEDIILFNK